MPDLPPTAVIIRLQYLPLSATSADVRAFFHGLRIPEGGVHIIGGENGDVFVGFASDEDARQAMRRDRGSIHGQEIRLLLSSRSEMTEVVAKVKTFYHNIDREQPQISKKLAAGSEETKNSWKPSNSQSSNILPPQIPSTYAPDSDYNKPAYARIPPNSGHEPYASSREPPVNGYNSHIGQRGAENGHQKFQYDKEPNNGPSFNRRPPLTNEADHPPRFYGGPPMKDPRQHPFPSRAPPIMPPEMKKDFGDNNHRGDSNLPPRIHRPLHTGAPPLMRNNFNGTFPPKMPDRSMDIGKDNRDSLNFGNNMPPQKPNGPPVRNESWRNGGRGGARERVWDSRHEGPGSFPDRKNFGNNAMKSDGFDDMVNRNKPHGFPQHSRGGMPPKPVRPPNGYMENVQYHNRSEHFLELSRLPNEMLRHNVIEQFIKPSVPLPFDSLKIVYSPEGILMHALVRLECDEDAKRLLARDGEQGIKIRASSKQMFDDAFDSAMSNPSPMVPDLPSPNGSEDRMDFKKRRSRSPEDRRRRRDRRSRSRERDVRRSRSPPLKRGKQDPNRWCLLLTNVPFRISEAELRTWLSERANPDHLVRTYYSNGNASDRWIAEYDNECMLERVKSIRTQLQGRTIKTSYIDNDYADELKKVEDKYGDAKKTENELKMMAEIQLQQLNGPSRDPPPVQHFPTPAFRGGRGACSRGRPPITGGHRGRGMSLVPTPMLLNTSYMSGSYMRGRGRGGGVARSGHFFNSNPIPARDREEQAIEDDYYTDLPAVDRDMASSLGEKGCVVSCYGFPSDLTLQDVVGFFEGYPVDENSIRMRMGEGGVGTGECLLAFEDSESAGKAVLYLNGKSLRGHSVRLLIAA